MRKKNDCPKCAARYAAPTGKKCQRDNSGNPNGSQREVGTNANGFGLLGLFQISLKKPDDSDHLAPAVRLKDVEDYVKEMGANLSQLLDVMVEKKQDKSAVLT